MGKFANDRKLAIAKVEKVEIGARYSAEVEAANMAIACLDQEQCTQIEWLTKSLSTAPLRVDTSISVEERRKNGESFRSTDIDVDVEQESKGDAKSTKQNAVTSNERRKQDTTEQKELAV